MNFNEEIEYLENLEFTCDTLYKKGSIPILFTAPHTMIQVKENGEIKLNEPYTKALALYLNKHTCAHALIKIKDTGLDPNRDNHDEFKEILYKLVQENGIKLVTDLHGASESRDFDIEFGTLNNLTADYSTINELEEAFQENGIFNIAHNEPFEGGAITQYLYNLKDIDVIQLEINYKYRDKNNLLELKRLADSLIKFINQYNEYTLTRERKYNISLYEPVDPSWYWYLKKLQEDESTMSYNAGYDINIEGYHYDTGCIDLPEDKWEYKFIKNKENNIHIYYIKDNDINSFIGYVTYHLNKVDNRYYCGVLIESKYRGQGYSKESLKLLIEKAKEQNIKTLYNSFEETRFNALSLFTKMGFKPTETKEINKFGKKEKVVIIKLDL